MIYHFAAPEHHLEDIAKAQARLITAIPIAEGKGLSEMIAENLKSMANVEAVIIDRWQLRDTDQQLLDAVQMLINIGFEAELLVIIDDAEIEETVHLMEGYTILNQAHRDITEELTLFISGEKLKEEAKNIWIGVASAKSGAGSTTLAMQLAMLLASVEPNTCYIEADGSGQLEQTAQWYNMQPMEGGYQYRGASFVTNAMNEDMLYNVIDFGQLSGRKLKMYNECQVKILVADAKPYGLSNLENTMRLRDEIEGRLEICLNFASEDGEEREKILERVASFSGYCRLHMNRLNPDFFSVTDNLSVLKRLVCGIIEFPEPKEKTLQRLPAVKEIGKVSFDKIARYKKQLATVGVTCMILVLLVTGVHGVTAKHREADGEEASAHSAKLPPVGIPEKFIKVPEQAEQITEAPTTEAVTEIPTEQPVEVSPEEVPTDAQMEQPDTAQPAEQPEAEAPVPEDPATETTTEVPESTEATTESAKKKKKKKKTTTEEATTETPPATEAAAPDIRKYDKDILSGSEVKKIIKNYGKYYAIIVETRNNGTGSYGLAGNSSKDIIDSKVSFYASLMYSGSDVSGLYLLQQ